MRTRAECFWISASSAFLLDEGESAVCVVLRICRVLLLQASEVPAGGKRECVVLQSSWRSQRDKTIHEY